MSGRRVLTDGVSFQEGFESYLRACPGPALAEKGLRLAAYQPVTGIPWLEPSALRRDGNGRSVRPLGSAGRYLRSISDIAAQVNCQPSYLSDAALRRGYSYSRALRWLRFFHGLCLRETRTPVLEMVSPLAAQETQDQEMQDLGAPDPCFESCHAGAMEMLEDGFPLWAAKVGFRGCMQVTCGADMG